LRQRFAVPRTFEPVTAGDGHLWRKREEIRPAAVLVPVIARDDELTVLFTKRAAHLQDHAGQISFPGGRAEPGDTTPLDTAMRETAEEIGLPRERVDVLGCLSDYTTVTGYRVTPVVGLVNSPLHLRLDELEVAEAFEVPLAFLLDPANHRRETRELQGRTVGYYVMRYGSHTIWGATAGMVVNLYRFLAE